MTDETPPTAPPGWHDDPNDPRSLRYWDGSQWTDQRAPKQAPPPVAEGARGSEWPPPRIAALVGAGAIIVGSLSPWATITSAFGSISVNGTDGDGVLTIVGAIVVAILVALAKYVGSIIVSLLTGALLLYDLIDVNRNISEVDNEFANASVGWGLWLATIAAAVALVSSIVLRQAARKATAVQTDQPTAD